MSTRLANCFFRLGGALVLTALALACGSCVTAKKSDPVSYVQEKDIPVTIAVLPARFAVSKAETKELQLDPESENGRFVADLVRGVVHNQFSGKGYETHVLTLVDKKLGSTKTPWREMAPADLCKLLNVEGLIYTNILSASMITAVAFNLYSIEAQIKMVNLRGQELGAWTDSSSRRKISIPTGPVGAAATVVEAILDESERKYMRVVVYDWGWKISQLIPDNPKAKALPEVLSVVTNVDKRLFATGDQIQVEITAEKGLTCSFDIGDYKKDLPVPHVEDVTYRGSYVVKEGDKTANQPIVIHMTKPNGVSRIWLETGGAIEVDGVPPPSPDKVKGAAGRQGITLTWDLPKSEDVRGFILERSDTAVGEYTPLASTNEQSHVDGNVQQGKTVYYHVRAVDAAGNKSAVKRPLKVTMPFFDEVTLGEVLKGSLIPGVYRLEGQAVVPARENVTIEPGARINMGKGASLLVKGNLVAAGEAKERILFTGEEWNGLRVEPGGVLDLSNTSVTGCVACIEVKGAPLTLRSVSVTGSKGSGIIVADDVVFEIEDIYVKGFEKGVTIDGGKGKLTKSTITGNKTGFQFNQGSLEFAENNVFGNGETDIASSQRMVLEGNYLGSASLKELRLQGKITVKSLLDAPSPQGRRIVLIEDKDVSPEELKERFATFKDQGIKAFQNRKYGEAHESLSKAIALRDDKDVYLYLAYTQMSLGEDAALTATLERGIKAYPYEVKLYEVYVKHLAAAGKKKEALAFLDRALKMNPDDYGLKALKESLEEKPAPPPVKEAVRKASEPDKEMLFSEAKKKGIEAFEKRQFKEAEEKLNQALSMKEDKDSYLYLVYAQMSLGEDEKLVSTLKKAIAAFPQEVRPYQMYVRYLTNTGEKKEALKVLGDALKIAPDDPTLRMQKEFLERGD